MLCIDAYRGLEQLADVGHGGPMFDAKAVWNLLLEQGLQTLALFPAAVAQRARNSHPSWGS